MFYWFCRWLSKMALIVLRRWRVEGAANLPRTGGVLVVSNHQSYWDPPAVGATFNRRVYVMAKEELFNVPVFKWVMRGVGAFPVKRGTFDRKALKVALEFLERGQVVGIFPEGKRSLTKELMPPQPGAALIAYKLNVPVVPVALIDTQGLFCKVRVKVGKPFYLRAAGEKASREEIAVGGERMMAAIAALMAENRDPNGS